MNRDPAAARFFVIQAVRMGGVIIAVYALLVLIGRAPWPNGVPVFVGWMLLAVGLTDALLVPTLLSRRWSSQPPKDRSP